MKGIGKGILAVMAILAMMAGGCIVHDDDDDDGYYYCDTCEDNSGWYIMTPNTLLLVGEACANTCAPGPDLCYDYLEDDIFYDYFLFDEHDYALEEININYRIENLGADYTNIAVELCSGDGLLCEEIDYIPDLAPGEVYPTWAASAVLDLALSDYYDCMAATDGECSMIWDIDVRLIEEDTCSTTTMDYYFEGWYYE